MPNIIQLHVRLLVLFSVFIGTSCTKKSTLSSSEQNHQPISTQELQLSTPGPNQFFSTPTPPKEDLKKEDLKSAHIKKSHQIQKETGNHNENIIKSENSATKTETTTLLFPAKENHTSEEETPSDTTLSFSIKFFSGFNYYLFNQTTTTETENGNFSQQTLSQMGFSIGVNLNPKMDVEFSHRQIKANIPTQSETILDTASSTRTSTMIDLSYILKELMRSSYSALVSFKNSLIPALSTDFDNSLVSVVSHELSSIGIGIKYKYYLKNNSEVFFKSQIFKLLEARSQNKISLAMSDKSQFSLSVGLNKFITNSAEIGVELEHNQAQFPYRYHRNGDDFTGELNSQDTSVLLKIGFHF